MADPRRLLDDAAELSELERRVLAAGSAAEPGERARKQIWTALSAKLPAPGGGPEGGPGDLGGPATGTAGGLGGAAAAGAKGVALISIGKAAALGISLGVLAMAGAGALAPRHSSPDAPVAAATAPAVPPATAALEPASRSEPSPGTPEESRAMPGLRGTPPPAAPIEATSDRPALETETGSSPPPAATGRASFPVASARSATTAPALAPIPVPPAAPIASALPVHEESRLIAAARTALRSGDAGRALALLEQARRRFSAGTLAQEREALSIEALAASGQRAAARERALRFLNAHPSSFHAARVRPFATDR